MAKKRKVSRIKIKKKSWFKVHAPKIFGQKVIGESYLSNVDDGLGKPLKVNLRELTGNMRDQNIQINFLISEVKNNALMTKVTGYSLAQSYVKRVVRKNTARLDDYVILKTKDGEEAIVKTLMITKHKAQRSTKTDLRLKMRDLLEKEIKKSDFANFVNSLVSGKLRLLLKRELSKILPVREASIRSIKLKRKVVLESKAPVKESEEKELAQEVSGEQVKEVSAEK